MTSATTDSGHDAEQPKNKLRSCSFTIDQILSKESPVKSSSQKKSFETDSVQWEQSKMYQSHMNPWLMSLLTQFSATESTAKMIENSMTASNRIMFDVLSKIYLFISEYIQFLTLMF